MSSESCTAVNPPGFVPFYGQGLRAKESQLGAMGTKEWLKAIKLHKYWPLISHWSYWQMLALTQDNVEYNIQMVRGTSITRGALGKLLRSIEELRERRPRLKKMMEDIRSRDVYLEAELSYLRKLIQTPLPTSEEDFLPILIVRCIQKMKEHIIDQNSTQEERRSIDQIIRMMRRNPVLNRAEQQLRKTPSIWEIHLTLESNALRSSRILPRILRERNRNISVDSGFEENSDAPSASKNLSSLWPTGAMAVMFESPTGNDNQALLSHSPFYRTEEPKQKLDH